MCAVFGRVSLRTCSCRAGGGAVVRWLAAGAALLLAAEMSRANAAIVWPPARNLPAGMAESLILECGSGVTLELTAIPGGTFKMGPTPDEERHPALRGIRRAGSWRTASGPSHGHARR